MASRPFSPFRNDRSALDLPVAALAGLAAAFAAFTIPSDLLAGLVGSTGLPDLLPAAQPPLGTTARIALASAGALTVFALAFLLLRWLDRFAAAAPARPVLAEPAPADPAPKLRRRDIHPDAPACRPISAIREFGEPAPPLAVKRKAPAIAPEPAPAPESAKPESLAALLARLERGLERRARPADAAPAQLDAADDRLQSAIDSLQRLASRDC